MNPQSAQRKTLLAMLLAVSFLTLSQTACAEEKVFKIIDTEVHLDMVKNVNRDSPVDYYINAGESDGLNESMLLDVFREVEIKDKNTGKKNKIMLPVGEIKTIRLGRDISISRISSLVSTANTPVLKYKSVMIGDYVIPKQKAEDLNINNSAPQINKNNKASSAETILEPSTILFKYHQWQLSEEATVMLSKIYEQISKVDEYRIFIEGHTDNSGGEEYALRLSEMRAQTIANYFIKTKGVPKKRVSFKGLGAENPTTSNDTEEGRTKNRRAVISFTK